MALDLGDGSSTVVCDAETTRKSVLKRGKSSGSCRSSRQNEAQRVPGLVASGGEDVRRDGVPTSITCSLPQSRPLALFITITH